MNKKALIISIIAVLISFIAGFFVANAFNRKEIADLQAEVGRWKNVQKNSPEPDTETALSEDEIRAKIAEADQNPENIEFQKNLALALYRYSTFRQDSTWLTDILRLLNRAYEKNPKDYNLITTLANIYFDISQSKNDADSLKKSRDFYQKALDIKPNDVDVRSDLGLTYLLADPPENEKSVAEFNKALKINPRHEKTLQNMIEALLAAGKTKEAEPFISKLKEVNPNNEALKDFTSQLEPANTNSQK
jgi:tetratricopeptide (TPR) repeat protein